MSDQRSCQMFTEEELFLWAAGGLGEDEAGQIAGHLPGCSSCSNQVATEELLVARLSEAAPPATPPPAVKGRLMARVVASKAQPRAEGVWLKRFESSRRGATWRRVAVAASLLLAVAVGFVSTRYLVPPWAELRSDVEAKERGLRSSLALRDNQIRALVKEVDLATARADAKPQPSINASWPVVAPDGRSVGSIVCLREGLNCYLEAHGLQRVGPARVYALWVEDGKGRMRHMGNFDADTSGDATFYTYANRELVNARNLVVTLEPWEVGRNRPQGPVMFVSQP